MNLYSAFHNLKVALQRNIQGQDIKHKTGGRNGSGGGSELLLEGDVEQMSFKGWWGCTPPAPNDQSPLLRPIAYK